VADVVYTPLWTPLLLAARDRGCRVMTGRELCVFQACDAFHLFTGLDAPVGVIGEAFDQIMRRRAGVREV
jgi:shikimate dehydrogenase